MLLLLHPDKCRLPGADHALQRVQTAAAALDCSGAPALVMTDALAARLTRARHVGIAAMQRALARDAPTYARRHRDCPQKLAGFFPRPGQPPLPSFVRHVPLPGLLSPVWRALLRTVIRVRQQVVEREWNGRREEQTLVGFACEQRHPRGEEPIQLHLPPEPAFLVAHVYEVHKSRQRLLFPEYARAVLDFVEGDARRCSLLAALPTVQHIWSTNDVDDDTGIAKWEEAARRGLGV